MHFFGYNLVKPGYVSYEEFGKKHWYFDKTKQNKIKQNENNSRVNFLVVR